MDSPLPLLLLALPFVAAAVILGISFARRRRGHGDEPAAESVHRLQADAAAVQDSTVHPTAVGRRRRPGRERRSASAARSTDL